MNATDPAVFISDFGDEYDALTDRNEKYRALRAEITRLRRDAHRDERFDPDEVTETVRRLSDSLDGYLIVFAANDFALPVSFRPGKIERQLLNEIRTAILANKYDASNPDLDDIRCELLDVHPRIHKAIVAEYRDGDVRYYLPEGSNESTNFITVREMVGLVDYTMNSFQRDGLSKTY